MRKVLSLFLAVTVASTASAEGLCAFLCQVGVCCSSKNVAPIPEPKEEKHACCKEKKASETKEAKESEPEDCCKLMNGQIAAPEATLVKAFAPQFDFPILLHEPILPQTQVSNLAKPSATDSNESRAPPGPEHRQDSPRAPPVARV